jgi:hypothetical protein
METPEYIHMRPGDTPPRLDEAAPFKAVVVIDADVTPEWQGQVSDWLVRSGCRYMMAWGKDCSAWDSSVDEANLVKHDFGEISEDDFVMTTWHANEPLEEAFWFSQFCAMHPSLELDRTYIVHISLESKDAAMLKTYVGAQELTND